jgi:2-polyprenyl-3-methyl-5-hydroxy-6-metoxy-1,4-benzoquinol methylase
MILDWGGDTGQSAVFNDGINELFSYDVGKLRPLKAGIKHFDLESNITFDLITCSHVLEHVPFPIGFVADLKKYIKPDGIIYFELPLERIMEPAKNHSIEERLNSKHHWHEHINFFSLESLRHIFKNAGFEVLNLELVDVNAPGNFDRVIMANLCSLKT